MFLKNIKIKKTRWIGLVRFRIGSNLESAFVSAWPMNASSPVWRPLPFPWPGLHPGASPSGAAGDVRRRRGDGDLLPSDVHALRRLLAGNASASSSLPFPVLGFSGARVLAFLLDPSLGPPVRASDDEVRACGCLGVAFPHCFLALLAPEIQARMVYLISPLSSHWFIALLLLAAAVVRFLIVL